MNPSNCFLMAMALGVAPLPLWAREEKDVAAPAAPALLAEVLAPQAPADAVASKGSLTIPDVHSTVDPAPTCSGRCSLIDISPHGDGWRVSRGMNGYTISEEAAITFQTPTLVIGQVDTEGGYDTLTVLGTAYSGQQTFLVPIPRQGTSTMTWSSDGSAQGEGWHVDFLPFVECANPANTPSCEGASCGDIDISCNGDEYVVSRGHAGYERNELAEITIQGPATVRMTMQTEYTFDTLAFGSDEYSGTGTATKELFFAGTYRMTWSSDSGDQDAGWTVTISPRADGLPLWIPNLVGSVLSICCCAGCIGLCCCMCTGTAQGSSRPATQLAQAPYAQAPNQQSYQLPVTAQQPLAAGGPPDFGGGFAPGSAPPFGAAYPGAGFQPQNAAFPNMPMAGAPEASAPSAFQFQPMPGLQPQPQPGFQFQPQPAQMPAFQFQSAGQPGAP